MKLSNTQHMLLVSAAGRDDGHIFPLAGPLAPSRRNRALESLLGRSLIAPVPAPSEEHVWRAEGGKSFGLIITQLGRNLLSAEDSSLSFTELFPSPSNRSDNDRNTSGSKIAKVLSLLKREHGVSVEEIGQATGWLPHTIRAALTGLRKKGHVIGRRRQQGVAVYHAKQEA